MEIRFELLPLPNYYTTPVHLHATDAAVYTALLYLSSGWTLKSQVRFAEIGNSVGVKRILIHL